MEKPLLVEVIAYAPTAFYHCTHCEVVWHEAKFGSTIHKEQLESSLPSDLALQYQEISLWADDLFRRYLDQIILKVVDAASLEGLYKSLKYGIHRYPAVIVNSQGRYTSRALERAGEEIANILGQGQLSGS